MPASTLILYGKLNPEQLKFANSKQIDLTMKTKRWFDFMVPLAEMDKHNDETRRRKRRGIGWTIFGMVVSLIATFAFVPFLIVLVGLTILLIISISKLNTLKKLDIGNHLRLFMLPFLVVMKEECAEDSKSKIKFDASTPINPKKVVNTTSTTPRGGGLPHVTTTFYNHPWLEAEFEMADGTALQLEFTDLVQKKHIKKRGSSGKIKYKNKMKIKHRLEMRISFRKDRYELASVNKLYEYVDYNEFHLFKVKNKTESFSLEQSILLKDVLAMIGGAYQNVKPIN
jgi:hypothetical protein